MVDHGHLQMLLGPEHGIGIGPFAGEEQRAKAGKVVFVDQRAFRVLLLDRAECGRRGEEDRDFVLARHTPKRPGIRRPDRLAFIEDRRIAGEKRPVDNI